MAPLRVKVPLPTFARLPGPPAASAIKPSKVELPSPVPTVNAVPPVGSEILTVPATAVWLLSWSVSNEPPLTVMLLVEDQNLVSPAT